MDIVMINYQVMEQQQIQKRQDSKLKTDDEINRLLINNRKKRIINDWVLEGGGIKLIGKKDYHFIERMVKFKQNIKDDMIESYLIET